VNDRSGSWRGVDPGPCPSLGYSRSSRSQRNDSAVESALRRVHRALDGQPVRSCQTFLGQTSGMARSRRSKRYSDRCGSGQGERGVKVIRWSAAKRARRKTRRDLTGSPSFRGGGWRWKNVSAPPAGTKIHVAIDSVGGAPVLGDARIWLAEHGLGQIMQVGAHSGGGGRRSAQSRLTPSGCARQLDAGAAGASGEPILRSRSGSPRKPVCSEVAPNGIRQS